MTEQTTGIETTFVGLFEGIHSPDSDQAQQPIQAVEIPLIQRDYAQGRVTDKVKDIRSAFLGAIRDAIVSDQHLSLDFVYGAVTKQGVFRPLDGQQRLSTLFLLHWYLANRTGQADPTAPWGRFSYDTRPSARRFCELLMKSPSPQGEEWERLSEWLTDQPWYQYVWKQDQTIASMLVMLEAIHSLFGDVDASLAWTRLTDPLEPAVSFYLLPIDEIGDGDELYIKMNSRGKPLTDFENFKARFEQALQPSERASTIAQKLDGPWADVLWPYHGDDQIVDDEFLRYIEFLVDIGEWRAGSPTEGPLHTRATQLLGGDGDHSSAALDFFEHAFDTWVRIDIAAYFEQLFRRPDQAPEHGDLRPALFTPDWLAGVNLFEMCCHNYGSMRGQRVRAFSLGLSILLYAVLIHRLEQTEDFPPRLRMLRNLVEASENEIRVDRMPDHLAEVEALIRSGDVKAIKSFNQAQVADEVHKAAFLSQHPPATPALALLEDHRLLRGTLTALELEPATIASRAKAFQGVFQENTHWPTLTGALLACGDYFRRRDVDRFLFGSPSTESSWRTLLTGPAQTPLDQVRAPLGRLLDSVAEHPGPLADAYQQIITPWLEARERDGHFDWRYHLVKYPAMREGTSGIYATASYELGYDLCALKRSQLNSNYRDPYLLAIYGSLGIDSAWLEDPWYTGLARTPRWLRMHRTDIAVRSVAAGLQIAVPQELRDEVGPILSAVAGVEEQPDGYLWAAPQLPIAGELVDSVDRVQMGAHLIKLLIEQLDPRHLRDDLLEELTVRGHMLSAQIGDRLREAENLGRHYVTTPRDLPGTWVAFELGNGRCIELILRPDDEGHVSLQVKAYPSYGRWNNLYSEFDHIPLGVEWSATDEEIVEAFMGHVATLQERRP